MFKYSINMAWSDEDEGYIATIPEFPGLSAFGDTPEQAAKEARIAAKGFIEVFREDGCKLPEPEKTMRYSGQIRLRFPKTLHAKLSEEAKREDVSLNTYLVHLLSENHIIHNIECKLDVVQDWMVNIIPNNSVVSTQSEIPYHIVYQDLENSKQTYFRV